MHFLNFTPEAHQDTYPKQSVQVVQKIIIMMIMIMIETTTTRKMTMFLLMTTLLLELRNIQENLFIILSIAII